MAERLNVALMVGDIDDEFTKGICYGAMHAAEDADMNLVILPGRYMHDSGIHGDESAYEYQHNTLFSYADMDGIDVAIVTLGTICSGNQQEDRDKLLELCGDIPTLVLASKEEDYPSVRYDNGKGIREAIDFLVKNNNCTVIGLLSGDLHNDDARERKEAYEEGLRANGITYDERLVAYGHMVANCEDAVKELLDANPGIQAVISANDEMAKSIYRVCRDRNIDIGRDLYVVGFDDIPECSRMNPPLATVRADATALGYEAVMACRKPWELSSMQDILLETGFVCRESVAPILAETDLTLKGRLRSGMTGDEAEAFGEDVLGYVFHAPFMNAEFIERKNEIRSLLRELLVLMFSGNGQDDPLTGIAKIHKMFVEILEKGDFERVEIGKFFVILERIFVKYADVFQHDKDNCLFQELRNEKAAWEHALVENITSSRLIMQAGLQRAMHTSNLISRDILTLDCEAEQSYSLVLANMPRINIPYSVLAVWEKPIRYRKGTRWKRPAMTLVKAVNEYGRYRRIQRTAQRCSTKKLFRNYLFDTEERFNAVAIDLFDREEQLGLLLCKLDYDELSYDEFLTYQVSMAVKTIRLFQLQKDTEKQLEETLERTRSLNVVLDNASMRDELTRLYNRRGFYRAAQEMMLGHKGEKGKYIVGYADLDYLKVINDHYGHDEGDFAIRGAALILQDSFGEDAIIGRIGGDEYVAIEYLPEGDRTEETRQKVNDNIRKYNTKWGKPYRISVSIGLQEFTVAKDRELQIMVEEADDLLYEQKNSRTTSLNVLLQNKQS